MHQHDDIAIIQTVLQGKQQAYTTLVARYQQYVFTLAMRYVNDRELAEELAQDVFVKAYRCLADFKGASKFSTWLYTIVHTTCLSHIRKRQNNTLLLAEEQMISIAGQHSTGEDASGRLEQKTQKQLIENAMKYLPTEDAQIITLFYQGEQSLAEIGAIMGLTPNNVKVRLFRGRQRLKEILEQRYMNELT